MVGDRFFLEQVLQLLQLCGILSREIIGQAEVFRGVVKFPNIILQRVFHVVAPRCTVDHTSQPTVVIDSTVAEHLEILRRMTVGCVGILCGIQHAHAGQRYLRHAVHGFRLWQSSGFEHGSRHIVDVMELATDFALGLNTLGPVHHHAVAGTAKICGHLLGPRKRCIRSHRPGRREMRE